MEIHCFLTSPFRYYVFVGGPECKCELRAEVFAENRYSAVSQAMTFLYEHSNHKDERIVYIYDLFLFNNLPEELREELIRFSVGDDLFAATIAHRTGCSLEKACALRDAFLISTKQ